ncbi:MAG: hypothetical protein B7X35_00260 [Halothiobacillus sp. 14-56-357]|uniref:TlpA family protein disulfide reductase n=1 Tax=Halothiobacillus sp. 15-55-196 TaxID=1970382 RepID=UPI000BD3983E|nr:TlpA disulfide reductase family protein [Halothiobacillus sp. 15-55-196]OZB37761.1 MAG: hypothetical protein B7X44_00205 [Halothiobacillus sp. 15-55-196]OZB57619.1 MAG: hypothetical protein B7X35_00260 [Halothiobacillus sp. 14-56-357]OZB78244.1 MAG: hypothetical protein B7X29_05560 [Halothiobacillus sp. 13-55-115]
MRPSPRFTIAILHTSVWRHVLSGLLLLMLASPVFSAPFEFSAQDVNGKTHTLSNERGNWVVINIWATWCPPCRKELPELAAFAKEHAKDHIKVWGLSVDTTASPDELSMFAQEHQIGYPIFKMNPQKLSVFGNIPGIPTTFLINPQGELVARHVGAITAQQLLQMIKSNS